MAKLFGTSGIRGLFNAEITPDLAIKVGQAVGTFAEKNEVVIGRDTRTSSLLLENAFISGFESTGGKVIRAGMIPTPTLAFAARKTGNIGVMITASHNPGEYNGIKLWNNDGSAFRESQENEIERIINDGNFRKVSWDQIKKSSSEEFVEEYINFVQKSVEISKEFKIAVDCGNGATAIASPLALENYASELKTIHTETHGIFPRGLEPSRENLKQLSAFVKKTKSDIGIAHDGDGDRVAVVDEKGNFVERDRLLAMLMKNELEGTSGHTVVVPIDTSKIIEDVAAEYSAHVVYSKVGDVSVAEYLKEKKGVFGGEPSGCFIFPKIYMCPDGILSGLKMLEYLSNEGKTVSELNKEIPHYHTQREVVKCKPDEKMKVYEKLAKKVEGLWGTGAQVSDVDGVRADFSDGWVLVRPSGTEPKVRITVEAKTKERASELLKKLS
ncbi:TPA: phosphoglucosamine mutase [archaeon]|nr:phosphoglucosamine mutase [Candidatus Naiadarchaeales archaeon SRR2090153.bin461]HIK02511.1 phosphoglucosamine mutase [Candidatus Naiadarchaeales archaeon SRR2090159.bin1288]